ncbi:bifunctional UDP-sugar hydrolase/5'-nucleotidase [Sphingobacterium faecale]|uniref:Uncharacterized protein n=1 Tax=Sphingobacterium faecale TaxID=2803775 RepID=A0ABS1QZN7_9SPHI|nr:hypothetical protein [Sphingobacterium faecale]MBL1407545.1 hypothetical protein [Sphingobacterium faecale]
MNNNNRRFFLKSSGLILGSFLLARLGMAKSPAQAARFNLRLDLKDVNFVFTGNLNRKQHLETTVAPILQNISAVYLDTGNFTAHSKAKTIDRVKQMNDLGCQAAALGRDELTMPETDLLTLARSCDFTLLNSLAVWQNRELSNRIKPFQLIQIVDRRVGVLAIGPVSLSGSEVHRLTSLAKRLREEEQCHMIICLVPEGHNKKKLKEIAEQSEAIDLFLCAATDAEVGLCYVLKNREHTDTTLIYGGKGGVEWGHYAANMESVGYVLPNTMGCYTPKNLPGLS